MARSSSPLSNKHFGSSKLPAAQIEQALNDALEAEDAPRALEVLDAAPHWMKKQPEFMVIRASVVQALGDDQEALRILREVESKNPNFTALYPLLATVYQERDWSAHAMQAAKRGLSDRNLTDEIRASLDQLIEEATAFIQQHATEFGLSFDKMQRAVIFHERALMAMGENKLADADYFSKEAIKIAPNWNPPHNNRAEALYFSGRAAEAISVSEEVLARDAENVFALSSLVTYHYGLDQKEQAWGYARRLGQLFKKFPKDSMNIEQVIKALALVEDTPTLWEIAKRYLDEPFDSLFSRSWHCLAVAAIRSGKWKDALKLMKKAEEGEPSPAVEKLLVELKATVNQSQPRPSWMPPAYPGVDLFFHAKVIDELGELEKNFSDPLTPFQKRKLDNFFQKYTFMFSAMKRLLWNKESHPAALQILVELGTPEADAEILRFGLSQTGDQGTRMQALMALVNTGRYTGPKIVTTWNEDQEEWRDVELNTQRIGAIKVNARPETMLLIEKAHKSKNPQEAMALMQRAVEIEPTSPIAIFNLGVLLVQNEKEEEGEALIYHSVEVDPTYTYGHASIALSEIKMGHELEALDHLEVVTHADIIAPETAVMANLVWVELSIRRHDYKSARRHLDLVAQIAPEYRLLESFEKTLKEAEDFDEKFGFILESQRESARRAHLKMLKTPLTREMSLTACLETNTKEMLIGSAHFLRALSSGKKEELAARLAQVLLDPKFLEQMLDNDLEKKERDAIQWMVETDGVRPWKEFVRKFGDDLEESTFWNISKPESIPGRLRMSGLLYTGTLEGQQIAFIPADVRMLLRKLFE